MLFLEVRSGLSQSLRSTRYNDCQNPPALWHLIESIILNFQFHPIGSPIQVSEISHITAASGMEMIRQLNSKLPIHSLEV